MANIALFADGAVLGLPCRAEVTPVNGAAGFSGALMLDSESFPRIFDALGVPRDAALAVGRAACVPKTNMEFSVSQSASVFLARAEGLAFVLYKSGSVSFVISLETKRLKNSGFGIFEFTADAAAFMGIESLFFKLGNDRIPSKYLQSAGLGPIDSCPPSLAASDMLLYAVCTLENKGEFANGLKALFNVSEMSFGAAKHGQGYSAGLYMEAFAVGNIQISSFFCAVEGKGFRISGKLKIDNFLLVLDCAASMTEFAISGYLPPGGEISLGNDWRVVELAVAISNKNGLMVTLLGRVMARRLMVFAAFSMSVLPTGASLNFVSAATSDLTIPNIVGAFTKAEIDGIEAFDFVRIEGFSLPGAQRIESRCIDSDAGTLAAGFNKAMEPCGLALKGSYRVIKFGKEKILVDEHCMRNYTIYADGRIALNPQFYFAPSDCVAFVGYEIRKGAFFCGVLKIFDFSVKLFFQTDDNGIMAYLNISPIKAGFFELAQSAGKSAPGVLKPSPGGMVSQFLDPNTHGPELFICMSKSQRCFYLDARLKIWDILCFDAHVVYADKKVSVDARFSFLSIFDVSFYLRADYSDFNSLNFEFALTADTGGLKRLVEKAVNKIDGAAREFNKRMDNAVGAIERARNSVNGLWSSISDFDRRINDCRRRIGAAPWYKRWYIAIGAGFEICGYEIAKAGVYIAIGVAQAALAVAEGILRAAQAVGAAALGAVKGFVQGIIALFYIERLAFAGSVGKSGGALGVKMDFVALGKSYSARGMLDMGGGAGERCGNLLNGMVEDKTADDVKALNSGARSAKKIYRTAAIEEQRTLYAEAAEYCRLTKSYMRDLNAAYTEEYGTAMPQLEEVTLGVDSAIREASQSADLILNLTDNMNFSEALGAVQAKIDSEPGSQVNRARGRSLEALRAQWKTVQTLKNEMRSLSRGINTNTRQGVFEAAQEKVEEVIGSMPARSAEEIYLVNPDKILNTAESMMYTKFKPSRGRTYFCPYNEPVIMNALDECRTDKSYGAQARQRKRGACRRADYKTRL